MAKEKVETTTFRCKECGAKYEWKKGTCSARCPKCVAKAEKKEE